MFYEINVSQNGRHVFATAQRSVTTLGEARTLYALLLHKFPESEGYACHVTHITTTGTPVSERDLAPNERRTPWRARS